MTPALIPKSLATRVGQVVYDASIEENVTVTEGMLVKYLDAKAKMSHGFLQIAEGLSDIRDHRLYLVEGCGSFNQWIQKAGMSRRKIFNYLRIIDQYANTSGIVQLSPDIQHLGVQKLLLATTLPKRDFECFKRTGEITTKDGRIVGIEEISAMPVR